MGSASSVIFHVSERVELSCQEEENNTRALVDGHALDSRWILEAELSPVDVEVSW